MLHNETKIDIDYQNDKINFMATKDEMMRNMSEVLEKYNDPDYVGDPLAIHDWRTGVNKALKVGDIKGIRRASLPSIQAEVVRIAIEGKSEQTRLSAAQLVLSQEGEGPIAKTEGTILFDRMPVDQLQAFISSKLQDLQQLAPNFKVDQLIPKVIDGETVFVVPENKLPANAQIPDPIPPEFEDDE